MSVPFEVEMTMTLSKEETDRLWDALNSMAKPDARTYFRGARAFRGDREVAYCATLDAWFAVKRLLGAVTAVFDTGPKPGLIDSMPVEIFLDLEEEEEFQ